MDSDFGSALSIFKDYFSKYDQFVRLNPRIAAEVEAIIRWSSYLVATRKSPILGELLSSGANLLQLCNDIILRQSNPQLRLDLGNKATQLKTFLTAIQSLELLAEIYARDTYGTVGKWAIITVIQIAKASIKLILLLAYDQGISRSQSIVPLDRIHFTEITELQKRFATKAKSVDLTAQPEPSTSTGSGKSSKSLVLKSSGRRMRSMTDAPPKGSRFNDSSDTTTESVRPFDRLQEQRLSLLLEKYREYRASSLSERQLYGELLHISRPIAHLALMGTLGTQSWISFVTSLAMDVSSLYLVRSPQPIPQASAAESATSTSHHIPQVCRFAPNERMELGQRTSSLLLYLLRSPFFDQYTKEKALEGLATAAENIPLFGHFLATFVNYIPDWQKDYFRVWSV